MLFLGGKFSKTPFKVKTLIIFFSREGFFLNIYNYWMWFLMWQQGISARVSSILLKDNILVAMKFLLWYSCKIHWMIWDQTKGFLLAIHKLVLDDIWLFSLRHFELVFLQDYRFLPGLHRCSYTITLYRFSNHVWPYILIANYMKYIVIRVFRKKGLNRTGFKLSLCN